MLRIHSWREYKAVKWRPSLFGLFPVWDFNEWSYCDKHISTGFIQPYAFISLDKYLGGGSLDYMLNMFPFINKNCHLYLKLYQFYLKFHIPTSSIWGKEMATDSSILAWKIPWMEDPGGLQSMGSQRVGHDRATSLHFTSLHFTSAGMYLYQHLVLAISFTLSILMSIDLLWILLKVKDIEHISCACL